MEQTLFEKIGGKNAVELASIKLYYHISEDERINHFFKDIDFKKQSIKMTAFLTYIFGGPSLYTGRNMRKAHKSVVAKGLNDEHVDAMLENVHTTLNEMGIEPELQKQVLAKLEKHRDDVLCR
jgi:hemoglobin